MLGFKSSQLNFSDPEWKTERACLHNSEIPGWEKDIFILK